MGFRAGSCRNRLGEGEGRAGARGLSLAQSGSLSLSLSLSLSGSRWLSLWLSPASSGPFWLSLAGKAWPRLFRHLSPPPEDGGNGNNDLETLPADAWRRMPPPPIPRPPGHLPSEAHCRWRPYRVECTGSLSTSKVKRHRARLVLGWGTAWEHLRVLSAYWVYCQSYSSGNRELNVCIGFPPGVIR